MDEPPQPDAYISYVQAPTIGMMLFVRTASSPMSYSEAVRGEIHALNKDRPIYDIEPMQQRIADSTARARFIAILLSTFAAIALALRCEERTRRPLPPKLAIPGVAGKRARKPRRHWNRDRSVRSPRRHSHSAYPAVRSEAERSANLFRRLRAARGSRDLSQLSA